MAEREISRKEEGKIELETGTMGSRKKWEASLFSAPKAR